MVEINVFCFIILFTCPSLCGLRIPFVKSTRILYKGSPTCEILVVNQCYLYPVCQGNTSKSVTLSSPFYFGVELH